MHSKNSILSLVFLLLFSLSCQVDKNKSLNVINTSKEISINEIFYDLEITPISFDNIEGFGYVKKIEFFDNKLFILDDEFSKSLQIFDEKGGFVQKIQSFERQNIYDFFIDIENNEILLYTQGKRIEKHTIKGDYIRTTRLDFVIEKLLTIQDGNLFCYLGYEPASENQKFNIAVLDKNTFELQNKFLYYREEPILSLEATNIFSSSQKDTLFSIPFDNKVYKLSADGIDIIYTLDFQNQFLTPELLNQEGNDFENKITHIDGLVAFDSNLLFHYRKSGRPEYRLIKNAGNEVIKIKEGKNFTDFLISFSLLHHTIFKEGEFISVIDLDHFRGLKDHFGDSIDPLHLKALEGEAFFAIFKYKFKTP